MLRDRARGELREATIHGATAVVVDERAHLERGGADILGEVVARGDP